MSEATERLYEQVIRALLKKTSPEEVDKFSIPALVRLWQLLDGRMKKKKDKESDPLDLPPDVEKAIYDLLDQVAISRISSKTEDLKS
jgi:hypothetical protein